MSSLQSAFLIFVTSIASGVLLSIVCGCAAPAELVELQPPMQIGDSVDLEMRITLVEKFTRLPNVRKYQAIPVQIEVLDAETETIVKWKAGKPQINTAGTEPLFPAAKVLEDQIIEVVLDKDFQPMTVRNLDQFMESTLSAIDQLEESLPKDKASEVVISHSRKSFKDPVSAERQALYRPSRYFLPYGHVLVSGEAVTQQRDIATNYSEKPLPMTITIELKPFKPTDSHYLVSVEQMVDQERLPDGMRLNGQPPGIVGRLSDSPRFNLIDKGEYKINRLTGWVEYARIEHTFTSNESTQSEIIEFRLPK